MRHKLADRRAGKVEDVASIILNVKKLALKIYSDEEKVIEIDVKGDGTVTAADITHDSDVEILNPDLYIATIAKNGHLRMRMYAQRGRGYTPADQNKRETKKQIIEDLLKRYDS